MLIPLWDLFSCYKVHWSKLLENRFFHGGHLHIMVQLWLLLLLPWALGLEVGKVEGIVLRGTLRVFVLPSS